MTLRGEGGKKIIPASITVVKDFLGRADGSSARDLLRVIPADEPSAIHAAAEGKLKLEL